MDSPAPPPPPLQPPPPPLYLGSIRPPITEEVTKFGPAPFWSKVKKILLFLVCGAFFGAIVAGAGTVFEVRWIEIAGLVVGLIIFLLGVLLSLFSQVAPCPYCHQIVGAGATDAVVESEEAEDVECRKCFELLVAQNGELRAFTEEDARSKGSVEVAAFRFAQWPQECIVCGAPPTRHEEVKKRRFEYEKLLVGKIGVQSGSVKQIPYCDQHGGAVELTMRDGEVRLIFPDLAMARRYLAANSTRKPVKA